MFASERDSTLSAASTATLVSESGVSVKGEDGETEPPPLPTKHIPLVEDLCGNGGGGEEEQNEVAPPMLPTKATSRRSTSRIDVSVLGMWHTSMKVGGVFAIWLKHLIILGRLALIGNVIEFEFYVF